MNAININNLTKSYDGSNKVLDNISFSIPKGEIFGFLGPNGSGKTTTVRILNGILTPSSGSAEILDKDIIKNPLDIHRISGVMTESASSYENLTGEENLLFFGRMHGIDEEEIKRRSGDILEKLEIYGAKDKKVKEYSTGMKKRISLAIALIHQPKILFLDEPTSGLDPETALNVTRLIKKLADENEVTIFLCTHQLKYAEEICSLYGFINKGKMLGIGSFHELIKDKGAGITLSIRGKFDGSKYGLVSYEKGIYKKSISNDEEASELLYNILNSGGRVYEVNHERWNLEKLYFSYMRGDNNE